MIKPIKNKTLFGLSAILGFFTIISVSSYDYWRRAPTRQIVHLYDGVSVSPQISFSALPVLKDAGYRTIVDMRPDGEVPDQPPSDKIAAEAKRLGLKFLYIPVPHGDQVPREVTINLAHAIETENNPVLLYCRSGRRATRAWAMAASLTAKGPSFAEIDQAAKNSGHSIDDLIPSLRKNIEDRTTSHKG